MYSVISHEIAKPFFCINFPLQLDMIYAGDERGLLLLSEAVDILSSQRSNKSGIYIGLLANSNLIMFLILNELNVL